MKYSNQPCTLNGHSFASKLEMNRYANLDILQKAKQIWELELQKRFRLEVNGQLICTYVADFVYKDENGKLVVEDTKGFETDVFKLKKKLFRAIHGFDITLVFAKGPRLKMGQKKRKSGGLRR